MSDHFELLRRIFAVALVSLLPASCAMLAPRDTDLPVETIEIDTAAGPRAFRVEIAADADSQRRGLMFRRELPPDAGMLFDLHREMRVAFWMKDTPLPLDILFLRADGIVSQIAENAEPYSMRSIRSDEPVRAVLEINGGRARGLGIRPGDRVRGSIFNIDQ